MVILLLDAQGVIEKNEEKVLIALDDKKFLIDRNSIISNIDVISESSKQTQAEERKMLKQVLSTKDVLYVSGKNITTFANFLYKDLLLSFTTPQQFIANCLLRCEYLLLVTVVGYAVRGFIL